MFSQLWDLIETWGFREDIKDIVAEDAEDVNYDDDDDDNDDDNISEDNKDEKYFFSKVSSVIPFRNHKFGLI